MTRQRDESNVPTYEDLRALVNQLVIAGDALADKLADITYDSVDSSDWWDDLENRRDRWAGTLGSALRALEGSKVG